MARRRSCGFSSIFSIGHNAAPRLPSLALGCCFLVFAGTRSFAQDSPLLRNFRAEARANFRVRLVVRIEVEGLGTEKIGAMTYAIPFRRAAEGRLAWRCTQRILTVSNDGSAQFEENLDDFSAVQVIGEGQDQVSAHRAPFRSWTVACNDAGMRQTFPAGSSSPPGVPAPSAAV